MRLFKCKRQDLAYLPFLRYLPLGAENSWMWKCGTQKLRDSEGKNATLYGRWHFLGTASWDWSVNRTLWFCQFRTRSNGQLTVLWKGAARRAGRSRCLWLSRGHCRTAVGNDCSQFLGRQNAGCLVSKAQARHSNNACPADEKFRVRIGRVASCRGREEGKT